VEPTNLGQTGRSHDKKIKKMKIDNKFNKEVKDSESTFLMLFCMLLGW